MIKKLRGKFVAVTMGGSLLVLLAVFLVLALSTGQGMRQQTWQMIEMALWQEETPRREESPRPQAFGLFTPAPQGRVLCFTVLVSPGGQAVMRTDPFFLEEEFGREELAALARSVADGPAEQGSFPQYRLRYGRRQTPGGMLVAFADSSAESAAMAQLLKSFLPVGGAALVVLLGAAVLLARWAVGPVEAAWEKQKQFVADASHELKTPLTVILSNTEMILRHPEGDGRRWAENIQAEGARMKSLTQALLTLARADAGGSRPQAQRVDLSFLAAGRALSFEPVVYESGRTLECQVEEGLWVWGDPEGLARLADILLDNAVRYAPAGAKIRLELKGLGRWARLTVQNPGDPIPQEELDRLFQRFYRSDPARSAGGFGLGLAIARGIVEEHRGRLWAQSSGGENRFTAQLPLERGKRGPKPEAHEKPAKKPAPPFFHGSR